MGQPKIVETTINNRTFKTQRMTARRAWKLNGQIAKLLSGSLDSLMDLASEDEAERDRAALKIIGRFIAENDMDSLVDFIVSLCTNTFCEGERITEANFDVVFADNMVDAGQVALWVVGVNLSSFFGESKFGGIAQDLVASASQKLHD